MELLQTTSTKSGGSFPHKKSNQSIKPILGLDKYQNPIHQESIWSSSVSQKYHVILQHSSPTVLIVSSFIKQHLQPNRVSSITYDESQLTMKKTAVEARSKGENPGIISLRRGK